MNHTINPLSVHYRFKMFCFYVSKTALISNNDKWKIVKCCWASWAPKYVCCLESNKRGPEAGTKRGRGGRPRFWIRFVTFTSQPCHVLTSLLWAKLVNTYWDEVDSGRTERRDSGTTGVCSTRDCSSCTKGVQINRTTSRYPFAYSAQRWEASTV